MSFSKRERQRNPKQQPSLPDLSAISPLEAEDIVDHFLESVQWQDFYLQGLWLPRLSKENPETYVALMGLIYRSRSEKPETTARVLKNLPKLLDDACADENPKKSKPACFLRDAIFEKTKPFAAQYENTIKQLGELRQPNQNSR